MVACSAFRTILLGVALAQVEIASGSAQTPNIPKEKISKSGQYLTARGAYDLVRQQRDKVLFVDIRTRSEISSVGMTQEIDAHIPYVEFNEFWEWDKSASRYRLDLNQDFGAAVARQLEKKGLGKDSKIILMCRSGDRSARAANLLTDLGYKDVVSVLDGFEGDLTSEGRREVNGWKNSLLPWSYKLDPAKVYFSR